ncbi:MAG: bifunctional 3,4-dihydroxy-2-butanone-4-phosphate synthase/GTP cyclohydrolase II [Bradymonadales bacterium]|nr:MAG: bifunctional 3,4-dihydroxy-2-butanone-4-phosphate synthase/GTP cyclohydrolase II [Bradymonadales bacterium]
MSFDPVPELLEELAAGRMIILLDDEDRENEGDLVCAADKVTPELINFMAMHGRGLICLSLAPEICDRLKLPLMVDQNRSPFRTNFTISIEAREGVTTGISAADRARTVQAAVQPDAKPEDLVSPGHVFPLRAEMGGVLKRAGQTEGSVDLASMAGLQGAGVICEILKEDGSMARRPELEVFAKKHQLKMGSIADLIAYRMRHESLVRREASAEIPTDFGNFKMIAYSNVLDGNQHVALVKGEISEDKACLVRVHSECLTGDLFSSHRCDCGDQLFAAMAQIGRAESGVLLYLRQEGRGIGLVNKLRAYQLQDEGLDTVDANHRLGFKADLRDYGIGAQILRDLSVRKMRLLTNNPRKIVGLEGYGMELVERVALEISSKPKNLHYLRTKRDRLGHLLNLTEKQRPSS